MGWNGDNGWMDGHLVCVYVWECASYSLQYNAHGRTCTRYDIGHLGHALSEDE